jgi:hypothetical protein
VLNGSSLAVRLVKGRHPRESQQALQCARHLGEREVAVGVIAWLLPEYGGRYVPSDAQRCPVSFPSVG